MGDQEVVQKEGEADTGAMHRTRVGQGAMVGGELSHGTRVLIAFISLAVLLVISVASVTGSVWAFPYVFVGTALTYITGGLYLIKKIIDHN